MILDTNIVIYASKPGGEHLRRWLDDPSAFISVVTRIEALGYTRLQEAERNALEAAFRSLP